MFFLFLLKESTHGLSGQPKGLTSILAADRQGNPSSQYEVIGSGKQAPPQGNAAWDVAQHGTPTTQGSSGDPRLKTLLNWLMLARSDALSEKNFFELSRHLGGGLTPAEQPLNTEPFKGPGESRRRGGGKGKRGRGKDRRGKGSRRGRRGRGSSSKSRSKRSIVYEKGGQYNIFNELGFFEGLQPVQLNSEQNMHVDSTAGGKHIIDNDSTRDITQLSFDLNNKGVRNQETNKGTKQLSPIIEVISLAAESGSKGKRQKRGSRQGNKDENIDIMITDEIDRLIFGESIPDTAPTGNPPQAATENGRRGRLARVSNIETTGTIETAAVRENGEKRSRSGGKRRGESNSTTRSGKSRRKSSRGRRNRRALPKDDYPSMLSAFTVPKGKLFRWTRNLPGMNFVNEFAFSSTERDVVVLMSYDPKLASLGFVNGATLYDFTGQQGVVALRPRVPSSPCYLMETSQTFPEIVAEMAVRNSSSVTTNTVIGLDGSGDPVSQEEQEALLQNTPSLRRQCRGRSIVRAKTYGMNPMDYSGPTTDIKMLTLDNEVTLTVRAQPANASKVSGGSVPEQLFRHWGRLRSVLGRGSGRLAHWIGQGRWVREPNEDQGLGQGGGQGFGQVGGQGLGQGIAQILGQGRGQGVGQGRGLGRGQNKGQDLVRGIGHVLGQVFGQGMPPGIRMKGPGNQTVLVTPVPTPVQGIWAPESA
ncbi:hypothetical protein EGW08_020141 [Elysia chlorotica]|uniref:Uncharacterized protein n=1 Tax=Elysia chlorotica TaxID=188477 RepID=A0A3S1H4N5_ELYCH|nr:hypothetical protein EGW08_020141 [Elysia chlorotica]